MLKINRYLILILLFFVGCSPIGTVPTSTNPLVPEGISDAARFDAENYAQT